MPRLVVIGLAAGLFSALFGVGGGIVIVPLLGLLLASRFDERAATGTSLAAIGVIALAGTIAYAVFGKLDVGAAALVGLPGAAGAVAGAALQQRLANRTIALGFAALLAGIGARLVAA